MCNQIAQKLAGVLKKPCTSGKNKASQWTTEQILSYLLLWWHLVANRNGMLLGSYP